MRFQLTSRGRAKYCLAFGELQIDYCTAYTLLTSGWDVSFGGVWKIGS